MKSLFQKLISLTLVLSIVALMCAVGVSAQKADSDSTYYKGVFYYRPITGEFFPDTDRADEYTYSDDYFRHSGKEYDPHLATVSFALCVASANSLREPSTEQGYLNMSRNAVAFLEDIGFSEIETNEDYRIKPSKDTFGVACAKKKIVDNGTEYTLLVILTRSAGYEAEWGNNFELGAEDNVEGFEACAEKSLAFAKDYVAKKNISGNIKVWTTGYSRGAAAVNLFSAKLIDEPAACLGDAVSLSAENLYAYTFSTPLAAAVANDPRSERYSGIFNRFNHTELVSALAPADMGFDRYGTDRMLYNADNYDRMLGYLDICNDLVGEYYSTQMNSRFYSPLKLSIQNGSTELVEDPDSYIPDDPRTYIEGLFTYLTQIAGGRKGYAEVYEQPLTDLIVYLFSMTETESSAFTDAILSDDDVLYLAAAMYAYFMRSKDSSTIFYNYSQVFNIVKSLSSLKSGSERKISALTMGNISMKLVRWLTMKPDKVLDEAADYYGSVMTNAMRASGAADEEIRSQAEKSRGKAMVHLISHLLLGNIWQSDRVDPIDLDNEQIKSAATLIGNALNLVADHVGEVVVSWLKTEDSYYDDFCPLTDAQITGCRRVFLSPAEPGAAVNGDVLDESGASVALIRDGRIVFAQDKWIGYTASDNGGFLRIPAGGDYRIKLVSNKRTELDVRICEYDVYDARSHEAFEQTASADPVTPLIISLPALADGQNMPSDTEYSVYRTSEVKATVLGDVDLGGEVDIIDVCFIQRHDAGMIELNEICSAQGDINGDGAADTVDASLLQRRLCEMPLPDGLADKIGKPLHAA